MKNLLFITWDGPQTSYMEGLFMPIFREIQKQSPQWNFHVLQFTWGNKERIWETKIVAEELGIHYQAHPIYRKPISAIGSFISLFQGAAKIEKYIQKHKIDVLMPRSTFPAYMVNKIKKFNGKIIFDSDGLPIEERVEFAGLKQNSRLYHFLKTTERKMLLRSDAVVTRSKKAISIHVQTIGETYREKFSVVLNGRDHESFRFSNSQRTEARKELAVEDNCVLLIYVGSLGHKYAVDELLKIYQNFSRKVFSKLLVLTGDQDYFYNRAAELDLQNVIVMRVAANKVARYISAADVGFALIYPTFSMQAAVPTKLGEYLLCGLPTIASKGIGDTEEILKNFTDCYILDHSKEIDFQAIQAFIEKPRNLTREEIHEKAKAFFSLEAAAASYLRVLNKFDK